MFLITIIFLMCVGVLIWAFFIDDVMFESVISKIIAGFTLFPLAVVLGFIVAFLSSALLSIPTLFMQTETIYREPISIYSLEDNQSVSGSFVLGSGRIESDLKYYYVIETENGKQIQSVKSSNSFIVESEENPNIVITDKRIKSKFWNFMLLDLNQLSDSKIIITVPEDTIIQNYNIDLK